MPEPFFKQIEENPHDENACAMAFYFETQDEANTYLAEDPTNRVQLPTPVSEKAGLFRVLDYLYL